MSLLDYNMENIPEEHSVPAGEYPVKLVKVSQKTSKSGNPMLEVILNIMEDADARNVFHYITLPTEGDEEGVRNQKLRRLKEFLTAFDIDTSGPVDTDELGGETGFAILKEEESEEFGTRNTVARFSARQ